VLPLSRFGRGSEDFMATLPLRRQRAQFCMRLRPFFNTPGSHGKVRTVAQRRPHLIVLQLELNDLYKSETNLFFFLLQYWNLNSGPHAC
jgi:hypothetical protein